MRSPHPDLDLVPFLNGELPSGQRARVAAHLDDCSQCRDTVACFRELMSRLSAAPPRTPHVDWARYDADLRSKIARHRQEAVVSPRSWSWSRPLPLAVATAVAGILVVLAINGAGRRGDQPPDPTTLEQAAIGARLDLLQHYRIVERLDLLEDLDVIRQLDGEG